MFCSQAEEEDVEMASPRSSRCSESRSRSSSAVCDGAAVVDKACVPVQASAADSMDVKSLQFGPMSVMTRIEDAAVKLSSEIGMLTNLQLDDNTLDSKLPV
jgi:hypothetical protein